MLPIINIPEKLIILYVLFHSKLFLFRFYIQGYHAIKNFIFIFIHVIIRSIHLKNYENILFYLLFFFSIRYYLEFFKDFIYLFRIFFPILRNYKYCNPNQKDQQL